MKEYVIDTISKETLEEYGYDSSQVSDEMMKKIAEVLRYTFRECVLDNLPQIAEDMDIPKSSNPYYTVSRVYNLNAGATKNWNYAKRRAVITMS